MSRMTRPPLPGSVRLTVAVVAVMSAAFAYPWASSTDRWVLACAAVLTLTVLAWWRGCFVTTILGQRARIALQPRSIRIPTVHESVTDLDAVTTVLLRVDGGTREPPTEMLAGYLNRFGLQCDSIRITTRLAGDDRRMWIGLRFSAAANLAALQARSTRIPLRATARNAARRLVEHLDDRGWTAHLVEPDQVPEMLAADAREGWRSVRDARGFLTAYGNAEPTVGSEATECWSVVEITGTRADPRISTGIAIRTEDPPHPLPGQAALTGRQASALAALHPLSSTRLLT
ncbi:type VII secretion protein EccE [Mycobacterium sp. DL592]|uniref:type VII secretion protein EccE n=1 Tax=Mycobacterium sp. DL592 TaxID=2675524 RepID=UPI0014219044|nr:type VII secretion protein EccE [Mycobacterium sp. DL592]